MTDIFLYRGETSPKDVKLRNPTLAANAPGVPIDAGGASPRVRQVYCQSLFVPIYLAAAALAAQPAWQAPLAGAPAVAKAQAGFASVPFNTAQLSVNFTNFGWHPPTSAAAPVAKAQAGNSFVPYNTAQLSVNFTNYGWHGPLAGAPLVARAMPGSSDVPYNTAQLSVNFTNYGWHRPLSPAPAVAKAVQGFSFVPFNTAQVVVAAYTKFWLPPLSVAVPVARASQGNAFVPFNTAQTPAVSTTIGIPLTTGDAPPRLRRVYHQASFWVPYQPPQPVITLALDMGGALPAGRSVYYQSNFVAAPYVVQVAVAYVKTLEWQQPLSKLAPLAARAPVGFSFVPFDTAQHFVAFVPIPLDFSGAASPNRRVYYQAQVKPLYVAPVAVPGIAGMAWYSQLGTVPDSVAYQPQQYPVDPPRFGEIAPSPPAETGTILMPGKAGGGGFSRKRFKEIQEQEAAERRAILEAQKAARDEAARVKALSQEARAAKIVARAEASSSQARLNDVVRASETARQFAEQSSKEEAAFLAAMLAEIANQEDEDDAIMLLVGF